MEEAFHLFEHRINEIGDLLLSSFQEIRRESKSTIAHSCLIQAIKPERNHRKFDLLEFLVNRIDQPQEALENALNQYNVAFKYDTNTIKQIKMRSLSVHSNFYYWVLKRYGPNSRIAQQCFDDILESRIWIDLKLQENPDIDVPEHLTSQAFNAICSIYLEFCNDRIPFKANYLPYLKLANDEEIIKPFFEIGLPIIFNLEVNCKLPFVIDYEYNRPGFKTPQKHRRKNNKVIKINKNEVKEWFRIFKILYYDHVPINNSITEIFRRYLEEFWERIISLGIDDEEN